jgi:hypothetical protein
VLLANESGGGCADISTTHPRVSVAKWLRTPRSERGLFEWPDGRRKPSAQAANEAANGKRQPSRADQDVAGSGLHDA